MPFELPQLDYNHNALEPHIDQKTMEIHHGKHHAGYTAKLNAAIDGTDHSNKSIDELMTSLDMSNSALRNNGGGYFNHSLFWKIMSPSGGGLPSGSLLMQLTEILDHLILLKMLFLKQQLHNLVLDGHGYVFLMEVN